MPSLNEQVATYKKLEEQVSNLRNGALQKFATRMKAFEEMACGPRFAMLRHEQRMSGQIPVAGHYLPAHRASTDRSLSSLRIEPAETKIEEPLVSKPEPNKTEPFRPESVVHRLRTPEAIAEVKAWTPEKKKPADIRAVDSTGMQEQLEGIKATQLEMLELLTASRLYLHFDWRDAYFKFGHSDNYLKPSSGKKGKGRKDTHESVGLEYIADGAGLRSKESMLKNLMKELHLQRDDDLFKPKRKSDWEEFKASKEFIGVLRSIGWPGADQDLERFLKDHRQGEFSI